MKTQTPKYDKEAKDRVRYARNLADLLWRKACQTMTREEQELLNRYMRIHEMVATVAPEDMERVNYTFDHIAEAAEKAEVLLIGCPSPTDTPSGLGWEKFQVLLKEDQDAE